MEWRENKDGREERRENNRQKKMYKGEKGEKAKEESRTAESAVRISMEVTPNAGKVFARFLPKNETHTG